MSSVPRSTMFRLERNNHLDNMQALLVSLYCNESFADVTIACCDGMLKAHKVILSDSSPYLASVLHETPSKHPVLILKDVSVREMQALLQFIYCGQVDVPEAELACLVATGCELKVKGFAVDFMRRVNSHSDCRFEDEEEGVEAEVTCDSLSSTSQNWKGLENSVAETLGEREKNVTEASPRNEEGPVILGTVSEAQSARDKDTTKTTPAGLAASLKASSLSVEATTSMSGITSSSNQASATSPNRCGTNSSLKKELSVPCQRETRFKGRKRVDVGIRPAAGRIRSSDKRESSSSPLDSRQSQATVPLAKKQRTSVSSTSSERKKQDQGYNEAPASSVISKPSTSEPQDGERPSNSSPGVSGSPTAWALELNLAHSNLMFFFGWKNLANTLLTAVNVATANASLCIACFNISSAFSPAQ